MTVDDATLTRWIQETQAKLALRPLTPGQLAMVQKMSGRVTSLKATHLETSTAKNALRTLLRAIKSRDLDTVLGLVQEAITDLRSLEPGEETGGEEVKAAIASLARRQADQSIHLGLRESQLKAFLKSQSSPPPEPKKGQATEGKRATTFVDDETRPAKDDIATSRLRRRLAEELRRAKRD